MNRLDEFKKPKRRFAQQLIEFLLVAPFIVIFLGLLTEYAYALNVNMTLTDGLKTATASIYSQIEPNMTADAIKTLVQDNLTSYLQANNVPTKGENAITVGYATVGDNAVFIASYKYIPAFTLPNIYFHIMPDEFNFLATSLIPSAFLDGNSGYATGIDSLALDAVWKGSNFSGVDTYDGVRNGVMNFTISGQAGITDKIVFLVPVIITGYESDNNYAIVSWDGKILDDGTNKYVVNTTDGKIYGWDGSTLTDTEEFARNSFKDGSIIFIHDSALSLSDMDALEENLSNYWITPTDSTDKISSSTVDGVLKRALALVDTNKLSVGNYDNLNVSYSGVSAGNTYKVKAYGYKVFVYDPSRDYINQLINFG